MSRVSISIQSEQLPLVMSFISPEVVFVIKCQCAGTIFAAASHNIGPRVLKHQGNFPHQTIRFLCTFRGRVGVVDSIRVLMQGQTPLTKIKDRFLPHVRTKQTRSLGCWSVVGPSFAPHLCTFQIGTKSIHNSPHVKCTPTLGLLFNTTKCRGVLRS